MSFKLAVKDYQIIKKASLEFIPGLNVITGPSNNGKSSIFKAIKANIYTTPGTSPIRAGQNSYAVGITYNGHTVILQKGLKESVYLVDGEKYTKFGTTTPPVVSNALNIKELVLNGNKEQLNFWDQMNYPFLLDKTPVELFRFIIDSGDSDKISQVLKDMVSDRQVISKEIDQLQGSINLIDTDIDTYEKQLEVAKPIIEACNNIIALQDRISRLNSLKTIKTNLDNISQQVELINNNEKRLEANLNVWSNFNQSIKIMSQKHNILKDTFIRLHTIIGDLSDSEEKLLDLAKVKDLEIIDVSGLVSMKNIHQDIITIRSKLESLDTISIINYTGSKDDIDKLFLLKNYQLASINIYKKYTEYDKSLSEASINKDQFIELKKLFDICPVCGQKIH